MLGRDEAARGEAEEAGDEVNSRHAAALAFVGWYLMLPPIVRHEDGGFTIVVQASVAKWVTKDSYDEADECKPIAAELIAEGTKDAAALPSGSFQWARAIAKTQATCIAADDPRLMRK